MRSRKPVHRTSADDNSNERPGQQETEVRRKRPPLNDITNVQSSSGLDTNKKCRSLEQEIARVPSSSAGISSTSPFLSPFPPAESIDSLRSVALATENASTVKSETLTGTEPSRFVPGPSSTAPSLLKCVVSMGVNQGSVMEQHAPGSQAASFSPSLQSSWSAGSTIRAESTVPTRDAHHSEERQYPHPFSSMDVLLPNSQESPSAPLCCREEDAFLDSDTPLPVAPPFPAHPAHSVGNFSDGHTANQPRVGEMCEAEPMNTEERRIELNENPNRTGQETAFVVNQLRSEFAGSQMDCHGQSVSAAFYYSSSHLLPSSASLAVFGICTDGEMEGGGSSCKKAPDPSIVSLQKRTENQLRITSVGGGDRGRERRAGYDGIDVELLNLFPASLKPTVDGDRDDSGASTSTIFPLVLPPTAQPISQEQYISIEDGLDQQAPEQVVETSENSEAVSAPWLSSFAAVHVASSANTVALPQEAAPAAAEAPGGPHASVLSGVDDPRLSFLPTLAADPLAAASPDLPASQIVTPVPTLPDVPASRLRGQMAVQPAVLMVRPEDTLVNIDRRMGDAQMAPEYAADIYRHFRLAESRRPLSANFMEVVQADITPAMRGILLDWLVEVAEEYRLVPDTLYLTCSCIDRFLSARNVARDRLQLLGVTCMLIASKYEEIFAPQVDEFVFITDNTYSREEVIAMERQVLNELHFELSLPTAKCFLRRFTRSAHAQASRQYPAVVFDCLCNYLCELSLLSYPLLRFLPSQIAASSVFLARLTLDPHRQPWNRTLFHYTGYSPVDLSSCVHCLHALHLNREQVALNSIREKYGQNRFQQVSTLTPLPVLPEEFFIPPPPQWLVGVNDNSAAILDPGVNPQGHLNLNLNAGGGAGVNPL